jgi:hypothetical protein
MANSNYSRAAGGFRFLPGGIRTTSPPDGLAEHEYPYLQNLRWTLENAPQARPQLAISQAAPVTGGGPVLTVEPSLGLYKIGGGVFYAGVQVDAGYSADSVSMTPFRPAQSPVAWEYVWDGVQARKLLPGVVTVAQKIGVAEPQVACEAFAMSPYDTEGTIPTGGGAVGLNGGTAGPITSGARFTDNVISSIVDPEYFLPSSVSIVLTSPTCSIQVSGTVPYNKDQVFAVGGILVRVIDVIAPVEGVIPIKSIFYFSGTTGRCSIGLGIGIQGSSDILSSLRKGALITIGTETPVYVLSVSSGPSGNVSIEVSTTSTHTTADTITALPTVIIDYATPAPTSAMTAGYVASTISTGIGTLTNNLGFNPLATRLFYDQDLFHFSVNINPVSALNEIKILMDVSDGTFTKDYYYYVVRPSDIAAGVSNKLTQLGVSQLAGQRQIIAEEATAQHVTQPSGQTNPADGVWSEITFPISSFTRVGSDQTKSLSTGTGVIQYLVNANASLAAQFSSVGAFGGFKPDIGIALNDYRFRYRGRSSVTGAKGNASPEMRYGVRPRRSAVFVTLPISAFDSQLDTWDVFVMGGGLDSYRYAGSVPIGSSNVFGYNMGEEQVTGAAVLEDDNYEPFPTIDIPFNATASFIGGTVITVTTAVANILHFLPGNVITAGQYQYTLRQRPTLISGTSYLLQTVESISASGNAGPISIYEPEIAAQPLPYVWGPDNNGTLFACGDKLRPDFIYTTKANAPDSCPDRNKEISVPTDPLVNGCLLDQTSFVASPSRWWRGYAGQAGGYVDYSWAEIPVGEGLAAPRGICSDGKAIYFVGHTGLNATSGGAAKSLTDAALRNLFPHEDVAGTDITYAGLTIYAPDYRYVINFRLTVCNGYLYFDYRDSSRTPRTMVIDLTRGIVLTDFNAYPITTRGVLTLPDSPAAGTRISRMYMGDIAGDILVESPTPDLAGETISCVLATRAEVAGDLRAGKQWGDAVLTALTGAAISVYPIVGDFVLPLALTTVASSFQITNVVSLGGGVLAQSLGLLLTWTDRGTVTIPYSWQPSYITKPETTTDRWTDWMNAGSVGNKFWQGFRVTVDTFGAPKVFSVYDERGVMQQAFTVTASGEVTQAFSFTQPFYSHMVRVEADSVPAREFDIEWVTQPAPSAVREWITQPGGHGQQGWQHVRQMMIAHLSTADLTLTVYADNVALAAITVANSGGKYAKTLLMLPPNKGLVYSYAVRSEQPFQLWVDDLELWCKSWSSPAAYANVKLLGSELGPLARI